MLGRGLIDHLTLFLLFVAGSELASLGLFDFSAIGWACGSYKSIVYDLMGAAVIWQLARQRFG
jgi:hypothetical protein